MDSKKIQFAKLENEAKATGQGEGVKAQVIIFYALIAPLL